MIDSLKLEAFHETRKRGTITVCIFFCLNLKDNGGNEDEFGRPFYRGAFDGFWWAFVTMSTVG